MKGPNRSQNTVIYLVNNTTYISPSIHLWRYSPFRALASLIRCLHSSLFVALLLHPLVPSSCSASLLTTSAHLVLGHPTGLVVWKFPFRTEHSMYRKSIPFPCNQVVVYLLIPSEASLRFSEHRFFYRVGSLPPRPSPNLEDQVVPFCPGHHL